MRERRHTLPLPLGDGVPFSKGLMARALVVTGLDPERAYLVARYADRDLAERGALSLDFDRLGEHPGDQLVQMRLGEGVLLVLPHELLLDQPGELVGTFGPETGSRQRLRHEALRVRKPPPFLPTERLWRSPVAHAATRAGARARSLASRSSSRGMTALSARTI